MALDKTVYGPYTSSQNYGSSAYVTSSFTPPANSYLVAAVILQNEAAPNTGDHDGPTTLSGGGLTWAKIESGQWTGSTGIADGIVQFWAAEVGGSPSSMTISVDTDTSIYRYWVVPVAYVGYKTSDPIGATAKDVSQTNALTSITLGAAPDASSAVLCLRYMGDFTQGDFAAGSGFAELGEVATEYIHGQLTERVGSTSTSVPLGAPTTNTSGPYGAIAIAIEVNAEPDDFPDVIDSSSNRTSTTNTTSHAITLPSVTAGQLIVVAFAVDGNPTISINTGVSGNNWNRIGQASNSTVVTGDVFWKVAEGSDALTLTTSASEQSSHAVYLLDEHGSAVEGASANGSSTNSDPPNLTPSWGSAKNLWLAARMGDSTVQPTVAPTNFVGLLSIAAAGTGGASAALAWRKFEGTSLNPGTFTSATEQWVSFTVAVKPSSGSTAALSGSSDVVVSASGGLLGSAALSASSAPAFTTTGNLAGSAALSGSTSVAFSIAGDALAVAALSGASDAAFATSGAVVGDAALDGISAPAFTVAGALDGAADLSGQAAVAFSTAGAMDAFAALSGSLNVAFAASGSVDGGAALTASAAVAFTTAGDLVGAADLAGQSDVAFSLEGSLADDAAGAMSGTASVSFAASASLDGASALSGASSVAFALSGDVAAVAVLSGSSSAEFSTDANLDADGDGLLSGSVDVAFSAAGNLSIESTAPVFAGGTSGRRRRGGGGKYAALDSEKKWREFLGLPPEIAPATSGPETIEIPAVAAKEISPRVGTSPLLAVAAPVARPSRSAVVAAKAAEAARRQQEEDDDEAATMMLVA